MSVNNLAFLALDTSCDTGMVVLCDRDHVYYSQTLPQKLSHAQLLCPAIDDALVALKNHGLVLACVFVGLGPGSFVGLRVALATALGFSFGRSLPLMGFCSHQALASSVLDSFENLSVAMKASGDLCYLTHIKPVWQSTELILKQDISAKLPDNTQLVSNLIIDNLESDKKIILTKSDGPSEFGIQKALCHRLLQEGQIIDESDYIKPNYIKGANVSVPKNVFLPTALQA